MAANLSKLLTINTLAAFCLLTISLGSTLTHSRDSYARGGDQSARQGVRTRNTQLRTQSVNTRTTSVSSNTPVSVPQNTTRVSSQISNSSAKVSNSTVNTVSNAIDKASLPKAFFNVDAQLGKTIDAPVNKKLFEASSSRIKQFARMQAIATKSKIVSGGNKVAKVTDADVLEAFSKLPPGFVQMAENLNDSQLAELATAGGDKKEARSTIIVDVHANDKNGGGLLFMEIPVGADQALKENKTPYSPLNFGPDNDLRRSNRRIEQSNAGSFIIS